MVVPVVSHLSDFTHKSIHSTWKLEKKNLDGALSLVTLPKWMYTYSLLPVSYKPPRPKLWRFFPCSHGEDSINYFLVAHYLENNVTGVISAGVRQCHSFRPRISPPWLSELRQPGWVFCKSCVRALVTLMVSYSMSEQHGQPTLYFTGKSMEPHLAVTFYLRFWQNDSGLWVLTWWYDTDVKQIPEETQIHNSVCVCVCVCVCAQVHACMYHSMSVWCVV